MREFESVVKWDLVFGSRNVSHNNYLQIYFIIYTFAVDLYFSTMNVIQLCFAYFQLSSFGKKNQGNTLVCLLLIKLCTCSYVYVDL